MYRDDKIRAAMGAKDWSIEILAEKSGVGVQTISLIRKGGANVKLETMKKVADALGIPMADLFEKRNGTAQEATT